MTVSKTGGRVETFPAFLPTSTHWLWMDARIQKIRGETKTCFTFIIVPRDGLAFKICPELKLYQIPFKYCLDKKDSKWELEKI